MSIPGYKQPLYVDSDVVETLVRDETKIPGKDYLIVDVRGDDYIGGHIPGALNIPSHELPEQLPKLVQEHAQVPQLFFHCALSQVRGPKAARQWAEAKALHQDATTAEKQTVSILRGGFGDWQRKHKADKKLVVEYDAAYWEEY